MFEVGGFAKIAERRKAMALGFAGAGRRIFGQFGPRPGPAAGRERRCGGHGGCSVQNAPAGENLPNFRQDHSRNISFGARSQYDSRLI
jgi:hypothetical protein